MDIEEGRRLKAAYDALLPATTIDAQVGLVFSDEWNAYHSWLIGNASALLALAEQPCPHVVTSDEGTSYCDLAESSALLARIEELETKLWIAAQVVRADGNIRDAALERAEAAEAKCITLRNAL